MATMTAAQKKKFERLRNQGKLEEARAFRRDALGKEKGKTETTSTTTKKPLAAIKDPEVKQAVKGDIAVEDLEAKRQIKYGGADTSTAFGDSATTYNPETGRYEYTETLSPEQQKILESGQGLTQTGQDLAQTQLDAWTKFGGGASPEERQRIEEEVFARLSRDTEQNRGRELEAKKQELFNQGIPYSDDPNSRYQKEVGDIGQRYDDMNAQARQEAVMMGGQELERGYNMDLTTHQQYLGDIASLQGQGTGLQVQGGPGFSGAQYGLTPASDIAATQEGNRINQAAVDAQKYGYGLQAQTAAQQLAADEAARAAAEEDSDGDGLP